MQRLFETQENKKYLAQKQKAEKLNKCCNSIQNQLNFYNSYLALPAHKIKEPAHLFQHNQFISNISSKKAVANQKYSLNFKQLKQIVKSLSLQQLQYKYKQVVQNNPNKTYVSRNIQANLYFQQIVNHSIQQNSILATDLPQTLINMTQPGGLSKMWPQFRNKYIQQFKQNYLQNSIDIEQAQRQYLKGPFKQDFSKPQTFIKIFVYLYSGQYLYKTINRSLINYQFALAPHLVTLILKGTKALIGDKANQIVNSQTLYRGIPVKLTQNQKKKNQLCVWPAFTSTTKQFGTLKKFVNNIEGGTIYIIKLMDQKHKSHGRNIGEWIIDFTDQFLKQHVHYSQYQVLLMPGFEFYVERVIKNGVYQTVIINQSTDYMIDRQTQQDEDQIYEQMRMVMQ